MRYLFTVLMALLVFISCKEKDTTYTIETEYGNMIVKLLETTPKHKANFIKLVNEGFYDSLLFHRVIKGSIIQGGDPTSKNAKPGQTLGSGDPGYMIPAEIGTPHFRGMLAAARKGVDNVEKASSGSQFYIVQSPIVDPQALNLIPTIRKFKYSQAQLSKYNRFGGLPTLDNDYTVFGEVIEGLDVLDKINSVPTDENERPLKDVRMKIYKTNSK